MSFIDCPECGHYDSVLAVTCPACGADRADLIQELCAIDQQWERDRHQYMVRSKHGQELVPTKGVAIVVVVLTLVMSTGVAKLFSTPNPVQDPPAHGLGAIIAGVLIIIGLCIGAWYYFKAQAYEKAHAAYLRKRAAAQSKHDGQAGGLT
jgi:hypothetical protein